MATITILWAMAAAATLTLALVHALVWVYDRRAMANLAFALVAVSLAGMAPIELHLLQASTPEEYGKWVRWFHVPIFVLIIGLVLFVWLHLRAGRVWLGCTVIALRCAILFANFVTEPNFNFREIGSLSQVQLLGQQVSAVGSAEASAWQWLATTSILLLIVFVGDAAIQLWRRGEREARLKAVLIGGGVLVSLLLAIGQTQLVIFGLAKFPMLVTPPFLFMVFVMAFELSRDYLHAARLAQDLRDSELRLDLAASAAGLGIWVLDIAANEARMSDKARLLHGLQQDEFINADKWLATIHPDDAGAVQRKVEQALMSAQEFAAEYRIRLANDEIRWIAAGGRSEWHAAGEATMIRGIVRDVTESKRSRHQIDELRRDLAHAGRVWSLGQLSSALAHELNQPLGAILRNAEAAQMMLQRPEVDLDELRAIVTDIKADDHRAGQVIDRLRALLTRRNIELQPLAVVGVVDDVIALVRPDAAARHVALDVSTAADLPLVMGDRVHLSQVLLNLIMNGMDAISEARGVGRRVVIEARYGTGGFAEVAVTDTGMGIAPEHVDKVFEPFFTTKAHGMGIGLPVSRTIVEAHGGRIWAENNAKEGATFRFTLPFAQGAMS